MTREPQKNNTALIIIAIIGVIGTICAATITVIGDYATGKQEHDAELTRIALALTSSQIEAIPTIPPVQPLTDTPTATSVQPIQTTITTPPDNPTPIPPPTTLAPPTTQVPPTTPAPPPTTTVPTTQIPSSYTIVSEACCGGNGYYLGVNLQEDPPDVVALGNDDGHTTRWTLESSDGITRIRTLSPGRYFNCYLDISTTSGDVKIDCDSQHSGTKWSFLNQNGYSQIISLSSGGYSGQFLTFNYIQLVIWIYSDASNTGTRWQLIGQQ